MGGGGGSQNNNITSTTLLPSWASGQVQTYLSMLRGLDVYNPYTGTTYATQNTDEIDGIAAIATRGRSSHSIISKGETYLRDALDGLKINTNSKMDTAYTKRAEAIITTFQEETLPRIHQTFNLSNNYGSDSHHWAQAKAAEQVMSQLQGIGMDIYYKDYVSERGLQISALGSAINYGTEDIHNAEILRQAGQFAREYTQGCLTDGWNRWNDTQDLHVKKNEIIGNAIRTLLGSVYRESVEPYYLPSPIAQLAGVGLVGLGVYGMMKSAPKQLPTDTSKAVPMGQDSTGMFTSQGRYPQQETSSLNYPSSGGE